MAALDGILNVNKPAGITSYGVVARVKRLSGERRVGHAGTLDPGATGVLPVCLGKATRLVEYLGATPKTYRAVIVLGAATDTYDAGGAILQRGDPSGIDRDKLEAALARFGGAISQTPPMYSALKHHGRPLYRLARSGISVERKSRTVTIHRLDILDCQLPEVSLEIECSKGTYIRSLAHDLGQALGCGAYLKTLARTAYGPFNIDAAVPLSRLEESFRDGSWERLVYPLDYVLRDLPAAFIDETAAKAIRNGNILTPASFILPGGSSGSRCRAYAPDGRFLGILRYIPDKQVWRPEKLFI